MQQVAAFCNTMAARNASMAKPTRQRRAVRNQGADKDNVDADQDEGDAVDAGEGRNPRQQQVADLGIAQLVPGNLGEERGQQIKSLPSKKAQASRLHSAEPKCIAERLATIQANRPK